jgi:hypothetical protein
MILLVAEAVACLVAQTVDSKLGPGFGSQSTRRRALPMPKGRTLDVERELLEDSSATGW